MTTARCPACGAAVPVGAPWCTLCYADLRPRAPQPAAAPAAPATPPQPAPAVAPAVAAPAAAASLALLTPALGSTLGSALDPALDAVLDAPVTSGADATRALAAWPCPGCGAGVPLDQDRCPQCFTAFLAGAEGDLTIDLPLIGVMRPGSLTKSSRVGVMLVGGLALTVFLTLAFALVGMLL